MKRTLFILAAALAPVAAPAQLVEDYNPPRSNCCLAGTAQTLANQLLDWNQLGRYHAENEKMKGQTDPQRVVFMGDSITDGWRLALYFPGKTYVNRGISGQTTPQMLVRMYEDVINLKPAVMIVLAGTNDIARNSGPETIEMVEENFMAMTELAHGHGIKVILCSVTPVSDYGQGKKTDGRPPSDILKLNTWMKEYAAKSHAIYADYFTALVDEKGFLKDGFSRDGLHPNEKGYELMAPVAAAAIQQALGR
ncbi:MAG TPA: SGNH/GDSL hydrolase family protein [Bryobacteraceae bacterium]|nr:SGNH/GDSL hydrolase family protein [Bryobacteraceae bacterium]